MGAISETHTNEFKDWVNNEALTKKPYSEELTNTIPTLKQIEAFLIKIKAINDFLTQKVWKTCYKTYFFKWIKKNL